MNGYVRRCALYTAMHGYVGLCKADVRLCMAIYGYVRPYMAMQGMVRPCKDMWSLCGAMHGYARLCMTMHGYVRLCTRATQREYSSKTLKHSIVKRVLVFKR